MQVKNEAVVASLPKRPTQAEIQNQSTPATRQHPSTAAKAIVSGERPRLEAKLEGPGRFRTELRGLQSTQSKANQGLERIQSVQDNLAGMRDLLVRMRGVADAASIPGPGPIERNQFQEEFLELRTQLAEVERETRFPGPGLLRLGDPEAFGGQASGVAPIRFPPRDPAAILQIPFDPIYAGVGTVSGAVRGQPGLDQAIEQLDSLTAVYQLVEERLEDRIREVGAALANKQAASSTTKEFADVDARLTRNQILDLPGRALAAQAHISPRSALALLE